ncbi:SLAIN motif-containing protein-like isoform X1 [Hemiscyllium ocellatum]|uniref:SLAIN motif-containing protein-like isoform X1 n=1 Tax=Hemiscyllium ocellatum TaxID=170820 RepID=UPI00296609A6|nr:SLAIN motif-containing protein-like isoform X1 [Hemiscyllium ocellatum]
MVGPSSTEPEAGVDPGAPNGSGCAAAIVTPLLDADKEVKKLQDLVKKLELQNEQLRCRSGRGRGGKALTGGGDRPPPPANGDLIERAPDVLDVELGPGDPLLADCEALLSNVLPGVARCYSEGGEEQPPPVYLEEDILELEPDFGTVEEDSWLYVSPKKTATTDANQKAQSPLKWCRQVLDHPSRETEAACRSLMCRLDQANRWRNIYCTPFASTCAYSNNTDVTSCSNLSNSSGFLKTSTKPVLTYGSSGYPNIHSALSSQSSIDSELSTSDDSISMGYKLQDLTDVQIMARLQEESLRQDYASSSASASRRSSSASLNSLRRGTYSDQEFDTYSLDDDDEYDYSLPQHSVHRYSPSPRNSPRSQSPVRGAATAGRVRPSRRCLQGRVSELMNYTKNQEEMRRSMPNLAKSGIRSSDSGRNSRSFESNLQIPSSRISRLQQSSAGSSGKLRYTTGNSGQISPSSRQSVKAIANSNSPLTTRHPVKTGYPCSGSTVRRIQSPTCSSISSPTGIATNGRSSSSAPVPRSIPTKSRVASTCTPTSTVSKTKLLQPSRRTLQLPKTHSTVTEDKWKEGCY